MARGRIGVSFNTVSSRSVWQALNTPGKPVREYVRRMALDTMAEAIENSPTNLVNNAKHRGGVVGTYKAGWRSDIKGTNLYVVRGRVYNLTRHAPIVEHGKPYVRRRQIFSWQHARAWATHRVTGERKLLPNPGGMVSTKVVHARKGRHVLAEALKSTAALYHHRRGLGIRL